MIEPLRLEGSWYPVGGSAAYRVVLHLEGTDYRLVGEGVQARHGPVTELHDQGRVGRAARRVEWPDGSMLELDGESAGLDERLAGRGGRSRAAAWLHRAERGPAWIALGAVLTLGIAGLTYGFGLPVAARMAVERLPVSAFERLSAGAMESLDDGWLAPSHLPAARSERIQARFQALVAGLPPDGFDYRLHLRRMDDTPNAFALPNGEIVMTDALIGLSTDPEQIDAVLLHEIGHVRLRHGVATLLQSRSIALVMTLATGSASGLGELGAGFATQVLTSGYSRRAESEADAFAFERMALNDRDPGAFATIIDALGSAGGSPVPGWLQSHPGTEDRAEAARRASGRWRDGL